MNPVLLLLLAISSSEALPSSSEQSFLREPFDQIATVKEHVTLPCRVVRKQGVLQWTRDDFGLGSDRNLEGFSRYTMTGSDEEGDYTLDINPVQLEDDGRFQCQVGAAEGVSPIRSRYAQLTVLVPPDPPLIFPSADTFKTVEGEDVELRCESRGGKPAAEITWFDDSNSVISMGVQTVQELLSDGKRFNTVSILRFKAGVKHDRRKFKCQAQNSANRQPQSVEISLQVHYPPHLTLTQLKPLSGNGNILEGNTARFRCDSESNPARVSFSWMVGGKEVPQGDTEVSEDGSASELALVGVDRRLHGQPVKCVAGNSIGKAEIEKRIQVSYSPVFLTRPENAAGMPGERVSLRCRVDANPPPVYTWLRNGHPVLGSNNQNVLNSNLTVVVSADTAGEYTCQASVEGHSMVEAKANIYMKGPPVIAPSVLSSASSLIAGSHKPRPNYVSHASEGSVGVLTCTAFSVPRSEVVEWRFGGRVVSDFVSDMLSDEEKYSVMEEETEDGVRSTLRVRGVSELDFGAYECEVKNAFGADQAVFHLRKQSSMPLLVVIVGALGGVILTLALILGVILCRRHLSSGKDANRDNKGLHGDILTVKHKLGPAIDSDGEDKSSSSSSSTSSTASDGVSNNSSSEMKVIEVRTSSSLSEVTTTTVNNRASRSEWGMDGTSEEGGYRPDAAYNQYYHNLVQASSAYFGGATGGGASPSYPSSSSPRSQSMLYPPPPPNGLRVRPDEVDAAPPPPPAYNNTSFDYVPASAILAGQPAVISNYRGGSHHLDNYSVYVNGNQGLMHSSANTSPSNTSSSGLGSSSGHGQGGFYQHEVVVPVHEKASSLATHV